jgi:large subunit ribosomal protein L17
MRHQVDYRKLGRHTSHRRALLRNLATSLILSERIETTLPKAKELRRVADQLITWGKEGTLHARRQAASFLLAPEAVQKLFDGLSARFKDRQGGYTRIFKFGFRRGDSAEMAAIEYLGYQLPAPKPKEEDTEKAKEKKKSEKKPAKPKAEKKAKETSEKKAPKKASEKKDEKKKSSDKESKWGIFGKKKDK